MMANFQKKLLDRYGQYQVFLVNGQQVRNSSKKAEEFGGFAIHSSQFPFIPKNEIWIEDDVKPDEVPFLVTDALQQLKILSQGASPDKAFDQGLAAEKKMRFNLEHIRLEKPETKNPRYTHEQSPFVRQYGAIGNVEVWLVDGHAVRDRWRTEFIEGGHGFTYVFIPLNEIWLESGLHEDEMQHILLHEYVERTLMKFKKVKYEAAHRIASKVEFQARSKGFSKEQALNLDTEKALQLAKHHE